MRNVIVLICLFYIITCQLSLTSSFGKNAKDSDDYISIDEIVLDTEEIEDEKQDGDDNDAKSGPTPEENLTILESEIIEEYTELTDEDFADALKYIENGEIYEAREILSSSFFAATSGSKRARIKGKLDEINKKLVYSPYPSHDSFVYTVKGGDSLSKIAKAFNTTYELIMMTNNKYRTNIRVGENLKIIKGPFDILVDKSDFVLTVILNGHYIKQFNIGTGKDNKTPVGVFEIAEKMKNPVWYSGDGVYPFGHPKNILGTRWIGLKDKPGLYGYGIHGTKFPESIGKAESNGCIRLVNENVEEVFAFVTKDSKVTIRD
ncbi:MAG: L,D-transpeptidase family protein [Candidatus Anammoxibacter sp.]